MQYMRNHGNRKITVKKSDLINKIKENKEKHIVSYNEAVEAYRFEAFEQLKKLGEKAKEGSLDLSLNLVTPIDNRDNYDKIIDMFEWEVNEEVELTQQEFNEYVHDDTEIARTALMSNSIYLNK